MATTTTARTTKARKAPAKASPKASTTKPRATRPRAATPKVEETPVTETETKGGPSLSGAYNFGMNFMESTVTGVLSLPLNVVSTLGVPDKATDAARDNQQFIAKGMHGAVDGVVHGITGIASKAPGFLGSMMSSAGKVLK